MNENTVPAVEKTIRLLDYLASLQNGATQSELAQILDISGATCYRIIQSLLKYGWLKKNGNRLELAQGLLPLARRILQTQEWQEQIKPFLVQLAEKLRLSVKLSVRHGSSEYMTALRVESPQPMSVSGRQGAIFPLIEGSVGAALLIRLTAKEVQKLIDAAPKELLEKSEPALLHDRIAECREKGYCLSNGRNRWGIEVISAPLLKGEEVIAAISILGLQNDFSDLPGLSKELLLVRQKCEQLLSKNF